MRPDCGWPAGCTGCMWPPAPGSPACSVIATGTEAIDAAGVLPHFTGIAVPDAFAPSARYRSATHALCNAHLLRELIAVVDHATAHPRTDTGMPAGWCWAQQVIDALLALKAVTDTGTLPDPDVLAAQRRLIVSAALIGAAAQGA